MDMSYERYASHESERQSASHEDYQLIVDIVKPWLLTRGNKQEGGEPLKRYNDGTFEYGVDDNGFFGDVEGYECVVEKSTLWDVAGEQPLQALQVGGRISFGYTPTFYLYSPTTGSHSATPEAIHIEITPNETAGSGLIRYVITREDIDSPTYVGYRQEQPKPASASRDTVEQFLDQKADIDLENTMIEGLRAPTTEECLALASIIQSLEY
jgi:hypothetical protein